MRTSARGSAKGCAAADAGGCTSTNDSVLDSIARAPYVSCAVQRQETVTVGFDRGEKSGIVNTY